MRTVNLKLLLWTLGVLLLAGTSVYFMHALQTRRHSGSFLERACRAQEAGNVEQALTYYARYLTWEPEDAATRAKLGLILDEQASNPSEWDGVVATFTEVLKRDPGRQDIRFRLVLDLIRLHRLSEAIANVQVLLRARSNQDAVSAAGDYPGAAELEHMLGWCHEASGDYPKATAAFARAIALDPRRVESYVLLAEVLLERLRQPEAAGKVMDDLVQANKQSFRAYLTRCQYRQRQNDLGGAEADLQEAMALAPAEPAVLLAAVSWAHTKEDPRKAAAARQGLTSLAHNLDHYAPHDRARLVGALADAWVRLGEPAQAEALWQRLAQEQPSDISSRFALFESALHANQLEHARTLLGELRRLGGEQGIYWRFGVAALTVREHPSDRAKLEECRKSLEQLGRRHKTWACIPLLQARIDELEDNLDKAIDHYQEAFALGDRQPRPVARLIQLLVSFKRLPDAQRILDEAATQTPLSPEMLRVAAEVALANQNALEALRLAAQAVSATSEDYRDYLWLGRIYHRAGAEPRAEEALRRSVILAPQTPETWIALAEQLGRTDKREEARALAHTARAKVSPKLSLYAEARCAAAIGLVTEAEALFRKALDQDAEDFVLLAHTADFFRRTDQPDKAVPLLEALLRLEGVAPAEYLVQARRQLANILATKGTESVKKALNLIDGNLLRHPNNPADVRARALVQAVEPSKRNAAARVFEETARRRPLAPEEQLELAQLFASEGDQLRSEAQIMDLLTTKPDDPQYLTFYLRQLMQRGEIDQAREQFPRLERLEPYSLRTLTLKEELHSR